MEEGGSHEGRNYTVNRVAEKRPRTERSDCEMDTEAGEKAGISRSQSKYKKGHMTNIYLTDSDEEAIVYVYQGLWGALQQDQQAL